MRAFYSIRLCLGVAVTAIALLLLQLPPVQAACAVGEFCYSDAIQPTDEVTCIPSQWCPGDQAAQICPGGSFCATPLTKQICPSSHYCPPGTIVPRPCSPLASCPEGSDRYFHWGALVFLILLLALLAAAPWLYQRFNTRSRKTQQLGVFDSIANNKTAVVRAGSVASSSPVAAAAAGSAANGAVSEHQHAVPTVPRMEVAFSNLCAAVDVNGSEKIILRDVSGHFRPGRLAAVMVRLAA